MKTKLKEFEKKMDTVADDLMHSDNEDELSMAEIWSGVLFIAVCFGLYQLPAINEAVQPIIEAFRSK